MERAEKKGLSRPLRRGDFIAVGLILLCCAVVFSWVGIAFLPATEGSFRRVIVNDDYDSLTIPVGSGDECRQTVFMKGTVHGLRIPVAVLDSSTQGIISLLLLGENGELIASSRVETDEVVDRFFQLFLFDNAIDAKEGLRCTLVLTAGPGEGLVAFLKSGDKASGNEDDVAEGYDLSSFLLTENGVRQAGTLALQYVTRYAGKFIYLPYIIFSILLTVFLEYLYFTLFIIRTPLHRVFFISSLFLGTVFLFIIPLRTAPDEYVHIANAYSYSNAVFGVGGDSNSSITVRAGDEMFLASYDFDATDIFAYQEVYEGLFDSAPEGEPVVIQARRAPGTFPPVYFPQTLGVIFARLIGAGKTGLLFMGRFFNLLFYSTIVALAVKIMPFMKPALMITALLPMCLQLSASFSYDAYVISLCFLFIALVLRCVCESGQTSIKDILWLGVTALLLAPAKTVYFPVLLLLFLIPAAKLTGKGFAAARISIFIAAIFLWSAFNLNALRASAGVMKTPQPAVMAVSLLANADNPALDASATLKQGSDEAGAEIRFVGFTTAEEPVYRVRENNEAFQRFTLSYILRHIPQTLLLVARTFWEQGPLWLQGLIGGRLGEIIAIDIEISWIFIIGLVLVLLASSLTDENDSFVLGKRARIFSLGLAALVFSLFFLGCITWTPINYSTVFGVQGRYLLPVLPLLLLAFRGHNLRFTKQVSSGLCFAGASLTALCALNAFLIIIQR